MKSCFFFGHREAGERLLPRMESVIERLILEERVRHFYVGGYGGLDQIAATAVKRLKQKYPKVTLRLGCHIILLNGPQRFLEDLTEPITRKAWSAHRSDTQSFEPTKSWWIHVTG